MFSKIYSGIGFGIMLIAFTGLPDQAKQLILSDPLSSTALFVGWLVLGMALVARR